MNTGVIDPKNIRSQALLNEYKGNLFEFVVAQQLAAKYKIEEIFYNELSPGISQMLGIQEKFVREHYSHLLIDLPLLAEHVVQYLYKRYNGIRRLTVVGKSSALSGLMRGHEADLILTSEDKIEHLISLKLSKANAFVNTKSAGVKSIFTTYFKKFPQSEEIQANFNCNLENHYHLMGHTICASVGVDYPLNFTSWIESGHPQLPGMLAQEQSRILHTLYYAIASDLYQKMDELYRIDANLFKQSILPLMGFADESMTQLTCFYVQEKKQYLFKDLLVEEGSDFTHGHIQLEPFRQDKSYFHLRLNDVILQLRIKPMNKFTTMAFKINCAIKKSN